MIGVRTPEKLDAVVVGLITPLDEVDNTATVGLAAGRIQGEEAIVTIAYGAAPRGLLALDVIAGSRDDVTGEALAVDASRVEKEGERSDRPSRFRRPVQPPEPCM